MEWKNYHEQVHRMVGTVESDSDQALRNRFVIDFGKKIR